MNMLNSCILEGNVAKVEVKETVKGSKVADFSIACERQYKNDTMERLKKQIVEFSRELHSRNKEIAELKEEKEKLSGRLSEVVEIIKEYVKISLTEPVTRSMIDEVELFKKAQEFLSEVEE